MQDIGSDIEDRKRRWLWLWEKGWISGNWACR